MSSTSTATAGSHIPIQPESFIARLQRLCLTAQFAWFAGHAITVIHAMAYLLIYRLSSEGARSYSRAYMGTLLSYGIILYKAHGAPQLSKNYLQRILLDENSQYLLLAAIWLTSSPIGVTLIPYTTFSVFHSLTFIRTDVIPTLAPSNSSLAGIAKQVILHFTQKYQTKALEMVAYSEIWVTFPILILYIVTGRLTIFSSLTYVNFLRFRYFFSPTTKQVFRNVRVRFDGWIEQNPSVPSMVKTVYVQIREALIKFGSINISDSAANTTNR